MSDFDPLCGISPYVRYLGTTERSQDVQPYTISMETDNVFIYVVAGKCIHTVNGRKRLLNRGMMEIIPPYSSQTITVVDDQPVSLFYIYFDLFETEESHRLICRPGYKDTKRIIPERELYFIDKDTFAQAADADCPEVLRLYESIYRLHFSDGLMAKLEQKKQMLELLLLFLNSTKIEETEKDQAKRGYVANAIRYIERNYADYNLCCESVARYLQVNAQYLSRLFGYELQMTLAKYIRRVRISRAKELFNLTDKITEIARKCGYTSIQSFSRSFKNETGVPPSAYVRK